VGVVTINANRGLDIALGQSPGVVTILHFVGLIGVAFKTGVIHSQGELPAAFYFHIRVGILLVVGMAAPAGHPLPAVHGGHIGAAVDVGIFSGAVGKLNHQVGVAVAA
jgi:hypothetical protein